MMLEACVVLGRDMAALIVAKALAVVEFIDSLGTGAAATKEEERARTAKKTEEIMLRLRLELAWDALSWWCAKRVVESRRRRVQVVSWWW